MVTGRTAHPHDARTAGVVTEPSAFYDVLASVLSCVCEQMEDVAANDQTYPGCPCIQYVSPGEPTIDCCSDDCGEDAGRLTVHMEDVFPSDVFPGAATSYEPCKAATWAVAVVVTVARCVQQGQDLQPNPDDLEAAARVQAIDAFAVMTALGCCVVGDAPAGKRKRRVVISGSTPITEEGGCVGTEIRALVEAGPICACQSGS